MATHVFVGPTLRAEEVSAAAPGAVLHPPAAHGDLLAHGLTAGDTVVLIDGYYHQSASVRHKEILELLSSGTRVVGCSSMGALRAAELHPFGMRGHGYVFELYRDGVIDGDDEVAVTHSEGPEYRIMSEPMVNFRYAVDKARQHDVITEPAAEEMLALVRETHYTARSWEGTERESEKLPEPRRTNVREAIAAVRSFLADHPEHRDVKARDAVDALRRLDELTVGPADRPEWTGSADWRNRFLHAWRVGFGGEEVDGQRIPPAALVRYQQLYHPDFPARWRAHVLDRIAATGPGTALDAAEAQGVTPGDVDPDRLRYWLTADETEQLTPRDALTLALVRSYRPPRLTGDLVGVAPDLMDDAAAKAEIARSRTINAELEAGAPHQSIRRIKADMLRRHVARTWHTGGDPEALLAAARDRGFVSVDEAAEAARPYLISRQFYPNKTDADRKPVVR